MIVIRLCMQEELNYNPFLRINQQELVEYSGGNSNPVQVLASLRKLKDGF